MKNDEGWKMNDEGWWFQAVEGFCLRTDEQTDEQTFVIVESLSRLKSQVDTLHCQKVSSKNSQIHKNITLWASSQCLALISHTLAFYTDNTSNSLTGEAAAPSHRPAIHRYGKDISKKSQLFLTRKWPESRWDNDPYCSNKDQTQRQKNFSNKILSTMPSKECTHKIIFTMMSGQPKLISSLFVEEKCWWSTSVQ